MGDDARLEESILNEAGIEVTVAASKDPSSWLKFALEADGILTRHAPITARPIEQLASSRGTALVPTISTKRAPKSTVFRSRTSPGIRRRRLPTTLGPWLLGCRGAYRCPTVSSPVGDGNRTVLQLSIA